MATLTPEYEIDDCAATVAPLVSGRLIEWLDEGADSRGERFVEMRRRLVAYFDRRHCLAAEALADETFRRIRHGLELGAALPATSPAHYCFAVAKHVLLEDVGREKSPNRPGEAWPSVDARTVPGVESDERSARPANQCDVVGHFLDALPAAAQQVVVEYYRDTRSAESDHRCEIAERMGITPSELGLRASRFRDSVMASVTPAGWTGGTAAMSNAPLLRRP
jgi:DNA-directed RNA polymerase specialized sigma24 family protein